MKKWMGILLALGILLSLSACGKTGPTGPGFSSAGKPQAETGGEAAPDPSQNESAGGELSLLYHMQRQYSLSYTENGYYYLTLEEERLADGRAARHLMYMDFATRQEMYLCSDASCAHNTADCASVFPSDEFGQSTALFVMNDSLYILSKEQDHDGSAVMGVLGGDLGASVEAAPTVLYRAKLDGTGREKLYAFDPSDTLEDLALGDRQGLYLIAKKVTTQQGDGYTYQTSSERKLVYFDLSSGKEKILFSMDFGDHIDWDIIGCAGRKLVLYGIDFGREVSPEERHSDDRSIYNNSSDVFATLDIDSRALHEVYRAPNSRNYEVGEGKLYLGTDGKIISVDLQTAAQSTLCAISQDSIWGIVGDRLYTRDGEDSTYYFIDVNTGEISHCGLVDRSTGASLKIIAFTSDQVLVIYDSDVTPGSDGSFTVHGYRYALIGKDDLFHGRDGFMPIQMCGSGR